MNLCSKLSALGAVLVLSTAFASADTTHYIVGGSGSTGFFGYSNTFGGPYSIQPAGTNNSTGTNATFGISPGTTWAPPLAAGDGEVSSWVSYDQFSGPTGGETSSTFDANGYYRYATSFNYLNPSFGSLTVAADDTVAIFLNGVQILPEGVIGSDAHCSDGTPNCSVGGSSTVFFNAPAGFNVVDLIVYQSGSLYQGVDWVGTVTETPEPNSLLLLGTGLLGSAGALFRRMRA
jgi:PEP-CTERM motif